MQQLPVREAVMAFLHKQNQPRTRAEIAAAMPDRQSNSVNRMLRDMVHRGTVVETRSGFALAPLEQRAPVAPIRPEEEK